MKPPIPETPNLLNIALVHAYDSDNLESTGIADMMTASSGPASQTIVTAVTWMGKAVTAAS